MKKLLLLISLLLIFSCSSSVEEKKAQVDKFDVRVNGESFLCVSVIWVGMGNYMTLTHDTGEGTMTYSISVKKITNLLIEKREN